jgi:hypothetical protein
MTWLARTGVRKGRTQQYRDSHRRAFFNGSMTVTDFGRKTWNKGICFIESAILWKGLQLDRLG